MTCIAAIAEEGRVWMAGDSLAVDGHYGLHERVGSKVFRRGAYLMGFTSSFRMGQILKYVADFDSVEASLPDAARPREPKMLDPLARHMVADFIPAIQDAFKAHHWGTEHNGQRQGGVFLVGVMGRLFTIDDDYQVGESLHGYDAVGCGAHYALGSLASTTGRPHRRLRRAIAAAAKHSAGVGGRVDLLSVPS